MAPQKNKHKSNKPLPDGFGPKCTLPENKRKNWFKQAIGFRSILMMLAGLIILTANLKNNDGYKWAWETLLKGNWKIIQTNRSASITKRYAMKMGYTAQLLEHIKTNTPENAILLFPTKAQLQEKSQYNIDPNITVRNWVLHYLYPRRVIYANEDYAPLRQQVNYVVIVNGHGYESLDIEPDQRPPFAVIPLN